MHPCLHRRRDAAGSTPLVTGVLAFVTVIAAPLCAQSAGAQSNPNPQPAPVVAPANTQSPVPAANQPQPVPAGADAKVQAAPPQDPKPTPATTPAPGATPAANPGPVPAVQQPGAVAPAEASATSGEAVGAVLVAEARVKCWSTDHSPVFEETLAQGATVRVGRSEGGHRLVLLPLGPVGYVSKKFTTEPAEGKVKTKGKAVAFRYRPKSGEAPVSALSEGAELVVVGEQDDWWKVRGAGIEAWVADAEIQVFDKPSAEQTVAVEQFAATHRQQSDAWIARQVELAEQARKAAENQKAYVAAEDAFRAEQAKPLAERKFDEIEAGLAKLAAEAAADSPLANGIAALQKKITEQKWLAEAVAVRDAEPVEPKDRPQIKPTVRDNLDRFDTIGWLRWRRALTGPGQYVIEKGGQDLFVVICSSNRYDLARFVDKEVGVIGPKRRPSNESLRILDIDKIEVLGTKR